MQNDDGNALVLRPSRLPTSSDTVRRFEPDTTDRAAIAEEIGISQLRKMRFDVVLQPQARGDWLLEGELGATVVQPCVVTLDPVTTRIDEKITRRFEANPPPLPPGAEVEMPEDETVEPLPEIIDLRALAIEALVLALPEYPRADGAGIDSLVFTEPGKTPMTDEEARPFSVLTELKNRLNKDDG